MNIKTKKITYCAMFAALTAAGAFFRIPLAFATITLQFLFTALSGLVLGPWLGALSQLIYVALGILGLPVLASGGGIGYLLQPTCGFVLALPLASLIIGLISRGSRKPARVVGAALAGLAVLYAIGLAYMVCILNGYLGKGMPLWDIVMLGMVPYLPGDFLKITVCAVLCAKLPEKIFIK